MKKKAKHLFLLFIIFCCSPVGLLAGSQSEVRVPKKFVLSSTSSLVAGPIKGTITSSSGDSFVAKCEIRGDCLLVRTIQKESGKEISEEEYELTIMDNVGMVMSSSGNIRYVLDFENKIFYHGQVNILLDKGCIITKTSIGKIDY